MSGKEPGVVIHTIPPVYDERSKILILGTMPSPKSREARFFYAHPQNRFWRVLAAVFGAPAPVTTPEKTAFALERGIALWDVLKSCRITGASDASIRDAEANDLSEIFDAADIAAVFTTGAAAAHLYDKHCRQRCAHYNAAVINLPSTSPANRGRYDLERLVGEYRVILEYLG